MPQTEIWAELEPVAEELLAAHVKRADGLPTDDDEFPKRWYAHELLPRELWTSENDLSEAELPIGIASALYVNLLTEDNLPHYSVDTRMISGVDGALGEWAGRWLAEEQRHSYLIRSYLHATKLIDERHLEDGRMAQVARGEVPEPETTMQGIAYVTIQELATRIAHRNTGNTLSDWLESTPEQETGIAAKVGRSVMQRVAKDENLHYLFYRGMADHLLENHPNEFMVAVNQVIRGFEMPGTGIPDFEHHKALIAGTGIYNARIFHDEVLDPIINKHWKLDRVDGLDEAGERAQSRLHRRLELLEKRADSIDEQAAEYVESIGA